jgi:hypothetical protein
VTKVLVRLQLSWLAVGCLLACTVSAQTVAPSAACPQTASALYARLSSVPLDEHRLFRIRDGRVDRPGLHLIFDDGKLAFTEDICGRITGAYFEGEGEVLLRPPNRVERESMALFTGMAILEEQFSAAYLRFNDDTAAQLEPYLRSIEEPDDFVQQANEATRGLATLDTLRLLFDFSHFLPATTGVEPPHPAFPRLLHAHLIGERLGAFEVYWDAAIPESLWAGQPRRSGDILFFDIWTSFSPAASPRESSSSEEASPAALASDISISAFRIRATVRPPTSLEATADLDVQVRNGGQRTLVFELSRYLKVDRVENDGRPVDFIQNQALEGSQLRRKGNDMVALVFPAPLAKGQQLKLRFDYAGDVLSEAGSGLLYVGERGTWYPNFGLSPARFDLEFRYPASWTLVATGREVPVEGDAKPGENENDKVSHWISDRPIPVAGFNLGRYIQAEARSGPVIVDAYGTKGVERSFPKPPPEVILPPVTHRIAPGEGGPVGTQPLLVAPPSPSPARNAQNVADEAANAVDSFSTWFGPYPYHSLALTQMPGDLSQGWPGLIFLSSFAFLSPQDQMDLKLDSVMRVLGSQVLVHETAHQWWGDLVLWKSYRDQWLMEGLANYSSLLVLEQKNPAQFRQVLEKYRSDLLSKNEHGEWLRDAGPVTLGQRLTSSHFPGGYDAISYERGTWLLHMLRSMLRDCDRGAHSQRSELSPDEPFFRALRRIRERYADKRLSTKDFISVFEEELPRPLWYERRRSLDWFVDSWINGKAIPSLTTRNVHIMSKDQKTMATGMIVQKDAPEDLVTAVPVYAQTASKSLVYIGEILADGSETSFRLSAPKDSREIVLDPYRTILTSLK